LRLLIYDQTEHPAKHVNEMTFAKVVCSTYTHYRYWNTCKL